MIHWQSKDRGFFLPWCNGTQLPESIAVCLFHHCLCHGWHCIAFHWLCNQCHYYTNWAKRAIVLPDVDISNGPSMPSTQQIGPAALVARLTVAQENTHLENMCLAHGRNSSMFTRVRHIPVSVQALSMDPLSWTINRILVFCSICYKHLFWGSTLILYVAALSAQQVECLLLGVQQPLKSFLKGVEHLWFHIKHLFHCGTWTWC